MHEPKRSPRRRPRWTVLALLFSFALIAASCADDDDGDTTDTTDATVDDNGESAAPASVECGLSLEGGSVDGTVEIGWIPWDEAIAVTHLWAYIMEENGVDVELTQLDVAPVYSALASGDIDLFLDSWLPVTHEDYWEDFGDDIEDLGVWYDAATLEIAVPEYMDVDSLADLAEYGDEVDFTITGIESGAGLTRITLDEVMPTYDLEGDWELVESSTPAMLAELSRATAAEEPIVVTLWTPHWAYDAYPIKNLEDPENALGDAEQIHSLARDGFTADMPEVAGCIQNFEMPADALAGLAFLVIEEYGEGSEREAVLEWMDEGDNRELVESWLA